jgi:hypothetical protein
VKRQKLIGAIGEAGCILLRHGRKHDIYHNPATGASEPVPRHNDVNERLAKRIIRSLAN